MTTHRLVSIRLPNAQRWITYLALIVVFISGVLWTLLHDVLQWGWMLAERRLLITHGVASAITLVVVGGLLPLHVRLAWRIGRNLASGIVTLSLMAILCTTGLMLYYGSDEWRDWIRVTHIGVGILIGLMVPLHILVGRIARVEQKNH